MDRIQSIEELVDRLAEIRDLRQGVLTNFYLDYSKHALWIEKEVLFYERIGNTLFLLKDNGGFCNVFFCTTCIDELQNGIASLIRKNAARTLMFDVVGNGKMLEEQLPAFAENGLREYVSLVRMSHAGLMDPELAVKSAEVVYANKEQTKQVHRLLLQHFDSRAEQIPYIEELQDYARQNHILCYLDGPKVAGFVIFELNKTTLYLRYWFVDPAYREKKIGSKLLRTFFYEGAATKRQMLWVITDNDNAIKRYVRYGFQQENLVDKVYIYKDII